MLHGLQHAVEQIFKPFFLWLLRSRIKDSEKLERTASVLAATAAFMSFWVVLGAAILWHEFMGNAPAGPNPIH